MILMDETIFDDFAQMTHYHLEDFMEKITNYGVNALGAIPGSNHPFWSDLKRWLDENWDLFDNETQEKAA